MREKNYFPKLQDIFKAKMTLAEIISPTPLYKDLHPGNKYEAEVLLKREEQQGAGAGHYRRRGPLARGLSIAYREDGRREYRL